jgi:methylmalonyl-CoA mutase C-terminal domain/subunit
MDLVRQHGLDDVLVVVGGIIPDVDVPRLQEMGVRGIFRPGSGMRDIVAFIEQNVRNRADAA